MIARNFENSLLQERGATLIVSLLILLVITIMGLASMRTATMDERMARYTREQAIAFQAAEAALRDAEVDLLTPASARAANISGLTGFAADCNPADPVLRGLCLPAAAGAEPAWSAQMAAASVVYGRFGGNPPLATTGGPSSVSAQPRYIVEGINTPLPGQSLKVGKSKPRYRVTAQGFGPRNEVQAWVQATLQP
ncbi:pilus assembly PilX family protein [Niveibacterium microcysteis]|uniref:Type 4 fimbrial biogenesis protein PilX N-terminal domain-containing protein n=1 Tax=Niveibacterium microcysteis TaxID=2811415 RepID=A0ABX7M1I4_9RHOO|nr:PilX N-terminal domain-containing pilus assembly protein [Niveibacterium microcysteis]QSI75635.1 hypothetical protein JY500_14170 [Niveibacterium microcysteis]